MTHANQARNDVRREPTGRAEAGYDESDRAADFSWQDRAAWKIWVFFFAFLWLSAWIPYAVSLVQK